MRPFDSPLAIAAVAALWAACGSSAPDAPPPYDGPAVAIAVAPLSLPGVTNARYTLTVANDADETVWTKTLESVDYGDGAGSLAYVGPCDADRTPNTVTLTVDALFSGAGGDVPLGGWSDPGPIAKETACRQDVDTPVDFDIALLRQAGQGFFDIAVSFRDIFCSAKVDCEYDSGSPIHLLHDPDGDRGPTMVVALACTAGPDEALPTSLHMSALKLTCPDGAGGENVHWILPHEGPGNLGGSPPEAYQIAIYRGIEQLSGVSKCYWNTAIGLDPAALSGTCRLSGKATASAGGFASGSTPAGTTYPEIAIEVDVGPNGGELDCGQNPLGSAGVAVDYGQDTYYDFEVACGAAPIAFGARVCGQVANQDATFIGLEAGLIVDVAGVKSPLYPLPDGATVDSCCLQ